MFEGPGLYFPGTASLAFELDKRVLVTLRDNRKLIGILRSFDQYANVMLEQTVERIIVGEQYCDMPLGLYVIRGENVVLLGTLEDNVPDMPSNMTRVSQAEIEKAQREEKVSNELKSSMRKRLDFLDLD